MKVMKTKSILLIVAVILLVITGCQIARDGIWPVKTSKQAEEYLGTPPEKIGDIQSIGKAKDVRQAVIAKHIDAQMDAKHLMEKDKAKYKLALEEVDINIEIGQAEWDSMIGSIERPGWLTSILLGTSGFGLYLAGAKKQRPGDYNKAEHQLSVQEEVDKAVRLTSTKNG